MPEPHRPSLYFDFDNTITLGDVLDRVIERFSVTEAWRGWEADWQAGRMATAECLARQVGDLRASPEALRDFMGEVAIDPAFARIAAWARAQGVPLRIVSDNFSPLIDAILERHGIAGIPVFANALAIDGDTMQARFPWRDPACSTCAHCKSAHVRRDPARPRIYVGDGLSDVCPSLLADVVFAKDSLARRLAERGIAHRPYRHLGEVLAYLEAHHGAPLPA